MLNSTLCATSRAMCAIVENYQEETGIRVPTVLQPYLGNKEFIPYDEKALKEFMDEVEKERAKKNKGKGEKKKGKKQAKKEEAKKEETEEQQKKEVDVDASTKPKEAAKDEKKPEAEAQKEAENAKEG